MDRDNGILLLLGGAAFALYMATAGAKTPNRLQNPGEEAARQTHMQHATVTPWGIGLISSQPCISTSHLISSRLL